MLGLERRCQREAVVSGRLLGTVTWHAAVNRTLSACSLCGEMRLGQVCDGAKRRPHGWHAYR